MTNEPVIEPLDARFGGDGIAVSVKAVLINGGRALLLRNPRQELELPGGRPDAGETFQQALRREVLEETGLHVEVGSYLDTWIYDIPAEGRVRIVTFVVSPELGETQKIMRLSSEHTGAEWCDIKRLPEEPLLPGGYRNSILLAAEMA
jgi:8-oxo-dGTP pyrophosphatase MutT (NUDIX family)